jgi:hypothetical protein
MTYIGKILVIVIMAFSLFFLAVSVVVFSTDTNWKDVSAKRQAKIDEINKNVSAASAEKKDLETRHEREKATHKQQLAAWEKEKANVADETKKRQDEIAELRKTLGTALENTRTNVEDAAARMKETDQVRTEITAVQKQASDYKAAQSELTDRIRVLEREVGVANQNKKDLQ